MARRGTKRRCERCGREYVVYSKRHQKFCKEQLCVAERTREYKRSSYRHRYKTDAAFQESEKQRCLKGLRERRSAAAKAGLPPAPATLLVPDLEPLIFGMLSVWTGSSDPAEVQASAREMGRRGQLLAVSGSATRDLPGGK